MKEKKSKQMESYTMFIDWKKTQDVNSPLSDYIFNTTPINTLVGFFVDKDKVTQIYIERQKSWNI